MATVISIKKHEEIVANLQADNYELELRNSNQAKKIAALEASRDEGVELIKSLRLKEQRLQTKYEDLLVKHQRMLRRHWWQFWKPNN